MLMLITSCAALAQSELDVRIKPSNDELKANIEGYIGSLGDRDEEALLRFSRGAEEQARKAAQALGYYQPQIDTDVKGGKTPRLVLNIDPGEPVHLRNVTIRIDGPAASLKSFRVPKSDALKTGAVLNHGHYEDAKRLIQNQASRYGFFSGYFTSQKLSVDPRAGVADIELIYDSGPRYSLGKVSFEGDTPFDEDLLQRMVPFKAGAPYDSELIAELNQAMQSSGYFESVRVDAAPTASKNDVIPVDVKLETRKPRTMGLGLGYSTDVGPRVKANWTRHWVNPQGHSYGWETEVSAPRQNVGVFYDIPLDPPLTDKLRFAGGYQNEEIADKDTLSKLLTLGPEWHSKLPSGWQRVVSLKWQREEYRLGDDSGLSTLLMPGVSYSYLKSDNRIDPHNGYRLEFADQSGQGRLGLGHQPGLRHRAGERLDHGLRQTPLPRSGAGRRQRHQWLQIGAAVAALLRRWRSERARLRLSEPVPGKLRGRPHRWPLHGCRQRRVSVLHRRKMAGRDLHRPGQLLQYPRTAEPQDRRRYRRALGFSGRADTPRPGPCDGRRRRHSTALFHGA